MPLCSKKRAVLARDEGVHDVGRHRLERRQPAALAEELADRLAVAVDDAARERRVVVGEAPEVGQVAHEDEVGAQRRADAHQREQSARHEQDPQRP